MRFDVNKAEKIWKIIEEGLEEFKKKTGPPAKETALQQNNEANANASIVENGSGSQEKANETNGADETATNGTSELTLSTVIENALKQTSLEKSTKKILKKLQKHTSVPLNVQAPKKKKFIKFLQTEFELDAAASETIWSSVSDTITSLNENKVSNGHSQSNGCSNDVTSQTNGVSGKKRKNSEQIEVVGKKAKNETNNNDEQSKEANGDASFDWQETILNLFNKNKGDRMAISALKTKVLKKYAKHGVSSSVDPKSVKKFNKQLKKINSLIVVDDFVQLKA